ncbi:MAG: Por secretion system C-terminal sorting protein, partial [Bacteroidetes bacterium]|nr:Por secretion system C-terminal sorting protein [Bacteroidota bacterium]
MLSLFFFISIQAHSQNVAPVVDDIPDQTIAEGSSFTTLYLDNYVSDDATSDADIVWSYIGNNELTVSIVDRVATISAPDADWYGSETITFTALDNDATDPLTGSDNAAFTVTAVNDAPVVSDISGQTVAEGASFSTISLDDYVSDVETPDASIAWTYSGNTSLTVSITDRVATISAPNANWNGSEIITFTATDN